jgi:hypothetical protein
MTVFATLLTLAMTGQIISHQTPKPDDLVVLISSRPISIWSEQGLIGRPTDETIPSGTFATCVSCSLVRYTPQQTRRYRALDESRARRGMPVNSMRADYYVTVSRLASSGAATSAPGFTCLSRDVYIVANVDAAKTAYRYVAAEHAKMKSKSRPGNKQRASALAARDMAKLQTELMARYSLSHAELEALIACGEANQWDAGSSGSKPMIAKKGGR